MSIYQSNRVLPYVYICREKNTEYFYIGYRYRNFVPSSEDLGKYYFTSNEYVNENFDNFDCTIVAEFFTKKAAFEFECQLIRETKSKFQLNRRPKVNFRRKNIYKQDARKSTKAAPVRKTSTKVSIHYSRFKKDFIGPVLSRRQAKLIRESIEK